MNTKTYQPKAKDIRREWHLVDVGGKTLGRVSTQIATLLMGKHKVKYTNHLDMGDYVVVVNASDIKVTGRKAKQKTYKKHSGYPGGFKEVKFEKLMEEAPEKIIIHAVSGMLPDNRLKAKRLVRLKVFKDANHPYKNKFRKESDEKKN